MLVQITALTLTGGASASARLTEQAAADSTPRLRQLAVYENPWAVFWALPDTFLTGLTRLVLYTNTITSLPTDVSKLHQLHCRASRGMARALVGLQQLRKLVLLPDGGNWVLVLLEELSAVTQLGELVVPSESWDERPQEPGFSLHRVVLDVCKAMPHCIVRKERKELLNL